MKLIIEDDEGRRTVVPFARPEMSIGRDEGNTIRLTERNVSRKHARIVRVNGHVEVEDLGSFNGIRINGERIQGKAKVTERDLIQIGDYDLAIEEEAALVPAIAPLSPAPTPVPAPPVAAAPVLLPPSAVTPVAPPPPPPAPAQVVRPPEKTPLLEMPAPLDDEASTLPPHQDPSNPRRQITSVIRVDILEAQRHRPVVDLPLNESPQLVVLNTQHEGRTFLCARSEITIGRTHENDIGLDHRSLSRTHAKLIREDGDEWRVIDMQSANGVLVNGEGYAQAAIRFGDVLELGHVKMRFEGPGGFVASPFARFGTKNRRNIFIGAAALFLLVVLIVVGIRAANRKTTVPPSPEPGALSASSTPKSDNPSPSQVNPPAPTPVAHPTPVRNPRPTPPPPPVVTPPTPPPPTPIAATPSTATPSGTRVRPREVAVVRPAPPPPVVVAPTPPTESPHDVAERLYGEGKALHKKQQLREAEQSFKRCLSVDPSYARCHMMLGSTYAMLKDFERGEFHYRKFLEMAPDDSNAERVRAIVQKYDESVATKGPQR